MTSPYLRARLRRGVYPRTLARGPGAPRRRALATILGEAPFAVCVRELRGEDLLHVLDSAYAASLLGRTRAEVEGRTDLELGIPPEVVARSVARARRVLATGEPEAFESDLVLPGRTIRLAGRIAPLARRAGRFIMIGQDVSALRGLERALVESNRLATIGTLAAAAAHEIAGPAGAALLSARALAEEGLGDAARGREDLLAIVEGLERVCTLTRDLRAVARPGEDRCRADLGAVVRSTLLLVGRAQRARVTAALEPVPPVRGGTVHLGQVVLNLVSNALRATEDGGGEVRVELRALPQRRIQLAVLDRGPGVPEHVRAHLFEPFVTSRAGAGGSGLGLFVVRMIVEDLGGAVALAARPGGGTEATVELPACEDG